jgi:hypothetical protein
VRMNMNVKTMTVEELIGQKKSIHLSGFQYMLGELRSTLQRVAADGNADLRLEAEMDRSQCFTPVNALVDSIINQCRAVFLQHSALECSAYANDEIFSGILGEMQASKALARSKLRLWLEDSSQILSTVCDMPLLHAHRALVAFLERRVASDPREDTALDLCKLKSLLVMSASETNELGENPLIQAIASGREVGRGMVALLAQAGVDLEATDRNGNTAAGAAAWRGEAEAVRALAELGADLQRSNPLGFTPLHLAVSQGRIDAARALVEFDACVNAVAYDCSTPLFLAVVNDKPEIVAWFCQMKSAAAVSTPALPAIAAPQPRAAVAAAVSRYNEEYFCNVWQCVLHAGNVEGVGQRVSVHFSVFGSGALGPLQGAAQSCLYSHYDGDPLPMVDPFFVTETPNLITGTLTYALPDAPGEHQPCTLWFAFGVSGYSAVEVALSPALQQPSQEKPRQVPHHLPPVVDIGAVDYNGRTALVVAAESGRANLVRLLVALGADPNAADSRGLTPAQAAAQAAAQRWDVTDSQLSETLETLKELGWTGKAYDA